jgi:hypothetical protein
MRTLGIATTSFFIHALFVLATVGVLLAGILTGLWLVVWRGLQFPVGPREIASLLGGGLLAALLGFVVYGVARGRWYKG